MEGFITIILPFVFLMNLLISEFLFKKRHINIDGKPPIKKTLFFAAKYLVLPVWAAMGIHAFGIGYSAFPNYVSLRFVAILLWIIGFIGLFIGKATLGRSFRLGTPMEPTVFNINGPYKISRNPMYVSLNLTLIASTLYTCSPGVLLLSVFIIIVHHYIILAEEAWLQHTFGQIYESYCQNVPRYISVTKTIKECLVMIKTGNRGDILLLLIGVIFLSQNLGLFSIDWNTYWPAIPLLYGFYLYYKFYRAHDKEDLIYATLLTGIGIFSFVLPPYLSWEEAIEWWPVCPFLWGLGIFFSYLTDRKDSSLLLPSITLILIGGFFLVSNFKWAQDYLKYWPLILIAYGIAFCLVNPVHAKQETT